MKTRLVLLSGLTYVFLIVATFILIYPILYLALGAFTTPAQLQATILLPIPNTLNLRTIVGTWNTGLWQAYAFTLVRCVFYIALALMVGLIGGYIFSKLNFPGRNKLFLLFLSGMVLPQIVLIVPMYLMMAWFPLTGGNNILGQGGHGLINNWRVLFVFGWVSPFAIFICKQSYDMLPNDYQDAAKLDGAGMFTIIYYVYGPLLKPVIGALIVVTFLSVWNDYLWPALTLTDHPEFVPISLRIVGIGVSGTSSAGGPPNPAQLMRFLLALWPPILVYMVLQRYFVQGLVASGLKG
jgi:multiple sugar transport system permease protein